MRVRRVVAEARSALADERRRRLLGAATARDCEPPPPSAFASFGSGSWIVPPARVTSPQHIEVGSGVTVLEHSFISVAAAVDGVIPRLRIGDRTRIGAQCHIACVGDIHIAEDVLIATRVYIGDTYHRYEDPSVPILDQPMATPAPVVIERGAFLGVNSAVLMGVRVGAGACVGAGAVVTADVEPYTVVVGNPGRVVRRWDPTERVWAAVRPDDG